MNSLFYVTIALKLCTGLSIAKQLIGYPGLLTNAELVCRWTQTKTLLARIIINNDLVIHRQVKTSDIISRRFGDFMTPLSRVQMRIKLTNASSRVTTDLYSGGGYTNTLARIESVCTFKLGVNCLM